MEEKLRRLMKHEGINSTRLAEILGIQASGISHIMSGRNKPSYDFLLKLLQRFPQISPDWLMLDRGPMYRDEIKKSAPEKAGNGRLGTASGGEFGVGAGGGELGGSSGARSVVGFGAEKHPGADAENSAGAGVSAGTRNIFGMNAGADGNAIGGTVGGAVGDRDAATRGGGAFGGNGGLDGGSREAGGVHGGGGYPEAGSGNQYADGKAAARDGVSDGDGVFQGGWRGGEAATPQPGVPTQQSASAMRAMPRPTSEISPAATYRTDGGFGGDYPGTGGGNRDAIGGTAGDRVADVLERYADSGKGAPGGDGGFGETGGGYPEAGNGNRDAIGATASGVRSGGYPEAGGVRSGNQYAGGGTAARGGEAGGATNQAKNVERIVVFYRDRTFSEYRPE